MKVLVFKDIKNKRWTIWSLDRKKHLGYSDELCMVNCHFEVQEDKRNRILKTKKRFPHAWVVGEIVEESFNKKSLITYSPFKSKYFLEKNKKVIRRKKLVFDNQGKLFSAF